MTDNSIPLHLGLIVDGNRRWAKDKGIVKIKGHQKGFENLKELGEYAILEKRIKFVSAYIFSTENWNREKEEVSYLMDLALKLVTRDIKELNKKNIRVMWLGRQENVSEKLKKAIKSAIDLTKENTAGTIGLCFNYGGQQEIVDAVNAIEGEATIEKINKNLYAPEFPPVDFMIRTSGEQRISNFMLWRMAYAEMYFEPSHFPDFSIEKLDTALEEYSFRKRRFGG